MLQTLLFWLHISIIIFGVLSGLFFSLAVVFTLITTHRIHLTVFNECVFTSIKKRLNLMPKNMDFLQFAIKKLFRRTISARQSRLLDYSIITSTFAIALIRYSFN